MALTPYSVSPRVRENNVGPKPTMNCGTRMPNFRAQWKCPYSWKPIEKRSPAAKATIPRTVSSNPLSSTSGDQPPGVLPGPPLRRQDVLDAGGGAEVRRVIEGTRDEGDDAPKRQPTRQEGRDRLLVGRVVDRRRHAARLTGGAGQRHGGERPVVQRGELPAACGRPVQRRLHVRQP